MNDDVFSKFYYFIKYTLIVQFYAITDNHKPYGSRGHICDYIALTFGIYVTTITIIIMNYDL